MACACGLYPRVFMLPIILLNILLHIYWGIASCSGSVYQSVSESRANTLISAARRPMTRMAAP